MLDHVRDEDLLAVDSDRFERLVQERAGGSDERMTGVVLLVAGRFADKDDLRSGRSFPRDCVGRPPIQLTAATSLESASQ